MPPPVAVPAHGQSATEQPYPLPHPGQAPAAAPGNVITETTEPDEAPEARTDTRLQGVALEWSRPEIGKAGISWFTVPRSKAIYPGDLAPLDFIDDGRDGLDTWHGWVNASSACWAAGRTAAAWAGPSCGALRRCMAAMSSCAIARAVDLRRGYVCRWACCCRARRAGRGRKRTDWQSVTDYGCAELVSVRSDISVPPCWAGHFCQSRQK